MRAPLCKASKCLGGSHWWMLFSKSSFFPKYFDSLDKKHFNIQLLVVLPFFFFFSPIKCLPSKVLLICFIFFFPKHLILKKKDQRNGSSCNWKGMIKTSNHFPSICPRILPSLHEYWENEASENSKSTEKISSCWHSCQHFSIKNKKK